MNEQPQETVHLCPEMGSDRTRCCDRHIIRDLPLDEPVTVNPAIVTCTGRK